MMKVLTKVQLQSENIILLPIIIRVEILFLGYYNHFKRVNCIECN